MRISRFTQTSGLIEIPWIDAFTKHGYAHARLDKQLQRKAIEKRFGHALVKGDGHLNQKERNHRPTARDEDSINTDE